jgi:hypothetical protein
MTLGKTNDNTESRVAASQEAVDPPVRLRQPQSGNGRIAVAQRLMDGGSIPPSSTDEQGESDESRIRRAVRE